eukprot:163206-Chlamydomonas_euryale.AAC.4
MALRRANDVGFTVAILEFVRIGLLVHVPAQPPWLPTYQIGLLFVRVCVLFVIFVVRSVLVKVLRNSPRHRMAVSHTHTRQSEAADSCSTCCAPTQKGAGRIPNMQAASTHSRPT